MDIPLSKGHTAQIDEIDAPLVAQYKWHALVKESHGTIYANACPTRYGRVAMHRLVLAAKLGRPLETHEIPEHADRNGLNNRRENLRLATRSQNKANQKKYRDCLSPYKGVSRLSAAHKKRWQARITVNNKTRFLGNFATQEEARDAYNAAAVKEFGEFALTT